jgi:hypothetical protein
MKKRNIIIIITVIAVLVVAVGVLAFLNAGNAEEKKMLEEEAIILIKSADQQLGEVDMGLIGKIGMEDFSANLDTSDSEPEEHLYSGVLLNDVLSALDIDISDYSTVVAKAVDGYNVAFDASEIQEDDNIYLATMRDGKPLGTKSSGGSGPYQIIVRDDAFSQRWCKFVIELELK